MARHHQHPHSHDQDHGGHQHAHGGGHHHQNFAVQYEPLILETGVNFRSDNVAKYTGQFGPVTAMAHWTFGNGVAGGGEVPGQFRRDSGYGAALSYAAGSFGATVAYDQYNPTLNASGGTGTVKKAAAAASYTFGNAKVMGGYR